jgi:hypothetical protein
MMVAGITLRGEQIVSIYDVQPWINGLDAFDELGFQGRGDEHADQDATSHGSDRSAAIVHFLAKHVPLAT